MYAAKMISDETARPTVAFFTDEERRGVSVNLKGVVQSVGVRELLTEKEREIGRQIQDKTQVTVRLYNNESINPGSVLYVLNERNLVVAKLSVFTVFKSRTFDYMCVGYGSFRTVKRDYRVVQRASDSTVSDAFIFIARAYREIELKETSKAIECFQKAIAADRGNPEAHTGLGYIYLESDMIPFAVREFDFAYLSRGRVYDREDRFMLLKGCALSRFKGVFNSELPKGNKTREKYLDEGVSFAKEANAVYGDDAETHLMLGKFYYDRSTDAMTKIENENDNKTVIEMKKVLELDPANVDAGMIAAKIFKKHGEKETALKYINAARSADPKNTEAISLEKAIKSMK
jgi:tetratricopeptide (TPR) repeat protein